MIPLKVLDFNSYFIVSMFSIIFSNFLTDHNLERMSSLLEVKVNGHRKGRSLLGLLWYYLKSYNYIAFQYLIKIYNTKNKMERKAER